MAEITQKKSSNARKPQSKRPPEEAAHDLTKLDEPQSTANPVGQSLAEEITGGMAVETPPKEPVSQDRPSDKGTFLQQIMSIPSFRARVISRVVKKLR